MKKLSIILLLIMISAPLYSYERLRSVSGQEVYWGEATVPIYYVPGESGMNQDPVAFSADAWTHDESYLNFTLYKTQETFIDASDSFNSIKYVNTDEIDGVIYFDDYDYVEGIPETLAYTLTTTADYSGRIVDTDVVVGLHMIDAAPGVSVDNVLEISVHEFGHFVGLDHICEFGGNIYEGIPDCGPITNPLTEPIMYPKAIHPQRINATPDDISGLLSIYRKSSRRRYKGCSFLGSVKDVSGGEPPSFMTFLLILPLVLLFYLRKKTHTYQPVRLLTK